VTEHYFGCHLVQCLVAPTVAQCCRRSALLGLYLYHPLVARHDANQHIVYLLCRQMIHMRLLLPQARHGLAWHGLASDLPATSHSGNQCRKLSLVNCFSAMLVLLPGTLYQATVRFKHRFNISSQRYYLLFSFVVLRNDSQSFLSMWTICPNDDNRNYFKGSFKKLSVRGTNYWRRVGKHVLNQRNFYLCHHSHIRTGVG